MGLFSKKICSICGSEISLLGNHGLKDGNLCKNCYKRLSPWFRNTKRSTISQIDEHLTYRLKNEADLFNFNPTVVLGDRYKIFLDEISGDFVVSRYDDYRKDNPDIVNVNQVLSVDTDIRENEDEILREVNGKEVSYVPKRFEYDYDFYVDIKVNSPYFDNMKFELGSTQKSNHRYGDQYNKYKYIQEQIQHALKPSRYPDAIMNNNSNDNLKEWYCPNCGEFNSDNFCKKCGREKPQLHWYCPNCGKENDSNYCVSCGTKRPNHL